MDMRASSLGCVELRRPGLETKKPTRKKKTCECGTTFYTLQDKELCFECECLEKHAPAKIEIDNLRSGGKKD